MLTSSLERTVQLADGRALGYAEFGDPRGTPVMFFHGLPSSRLAATMLGDPARRLGVRLISLDRPGFGLSDDAPQRRILDWPRDVEQLADQLGLDHFAVMGISGALPYVFACALRIPGRLSATAIVSGLGPLGAPGVLEGMNRESRTLYRLALRSPRLGRVWMRMFATAATASPALVFRQQMSYLPEVDQAVFAGPEMREARLRDIAEAFRQGPAAACRDAELHVSDWGFTLADVTANVIHWQGALDRHHPVAMGRYVVEALPNVQSIVVPDSGTFGFIEHADELFELLL
jgi:pimeloyl-ACP methyl ester carboxylesterase